MAKTLTQIRTALENRKKDISDVPNDTFIEWCNFIGEAVYDSVKGTDPERFVNTSTTFTVATDPQTNSLPSDFDDIQSWDMGFFEINDSDSKDTDIRLIRTGPGSRQRGYFITGNTDVVFTGINNGTQFRLRYLPIRTDAAALADSFTIDATGSGAVLIPDGKLRFMVAALDTLYTIWDEMPGDEVLADQRFVRQLSLLLSNVRREPDAYGMPDFTVTF